jgi:hypothetical protein
MPAAGDETPTGGAIASPTATGRSTTTPARKIIHDRSVSDSRRPNSRSAWTAGTSGVSAAAGHPKKLTTG